MQRAAVPLGRRRTGRRAAPRRPAGPGCAQSIRSAVTSSSRTRATSAGSSFGVRAASASSSTAAGSRSTGTDTPTRNASQSTDGGQLGAEPLPGPARKPAESRSRGALLQRLGQHRRGALPADRPRGPAPGVEQQRRGGEQLAGQVRGDHLRRRRPCGGRSSGNAYGRATPGSGRVAIERHCAAPPRQVGQGHAGRRAGGSRGHLGDVVGGDRQPGRQPVRGAARVAELGRVPAQHVGPAADRGQLPPPRRW